MSGDQIQTILDAISDLKDEVNVLKTKRINIEDIGIGSFVGWVKITVAAIVIVIGAGSTGYAVLSQVASVEHSLQALANTYQTHMTYIHKKKR